MIGRLVEVSYVRSLGRATGADLTGPVRRPVRGVLRQLRVGDLLRVEVGRCPVWETTPVEQIRWLRATEAGVEVVGHTLGAAPPTGLDVVDLLCEIHTARSVYRIKVVVG